MGIGALKNTIRQIEGAVITVEPFIASSGKNLRILLLNHTYAPFDQCRTEVTDLQHWSGKSFQTDSKPKDVVVTTSASVDPIGLLTDYSGYSLAIHKDNEFEFESGQEPYKKVARSTSGIWMAKMVTTTVGPKRIGHAVYFSWYPNREEPFGKESDPRWST